MGNYCTNMQSAPGHHPSCSAATDSGGPDGKWRNCLDWNFYLKYNLDKGVSLQGLHIQKWFSGSLSCLDPTPSSFSCAWAFFYPLARQNAGSPVKIPRKLNSRSLQRQSCRPAGHTCVSMAELLECTRQHFKGGSARILWEWRLIIGCKNNQPL